MPQFPPQVYDYCLAGISPEDNEQDMQEAMTKYIEQFNAMCDNYIEQGFLIWSRRKPNERLAGYMAGTLAQELDYVLNPGLMALVKAGQAQPPQSPIWSLLIQLRDKDYERFRKDFESLLGRFTGDALEELTA